MRLWRNLFFSLIILVVSYRASGQALSVRPDMRFRNFSGNSGFVNEYMANVLRDKKGYVWICGGGIYRFDGKAYKRYSNHDKKPNVLKDNYVADLVEDNYGRLWVGNGGGLCFYDYRTDGFHYLDTVGNRHIRFAYFFSILNDHLWFISNHGLCSVDLKTLKVSATAFSLSEPVTGVFAVDSNTLLISVRQEAYLYHIAQKSFEPRSCLNGIVQGCLLWCGDRYFLTRAVGGLWTLQSLDKLPELIAGTENYSISSMIKVPQLTGDSILWISTVDAGIILFNTVTNRSVLNFTHSADDPYSLQTNEITQLRAGPGEMVWIATGTGISLLNIRDQGIKTRVMPDRYIRKIAEDRFDKGKALISFAGHGLARIDWNTQRQSDSWFSINSENRNSAVGSDIFDMVQMDRYRWLLCTSNGLMVWDPRKGVEKYAPSPPGYKGGFSFLRSILRIDSNTYYITSSNGLLLYRPSKNSLSFIIPRTDNRDLSAGDMHLGEYDHLHSLWVGTSAGLLHYDMLTGKAAVFRVVNKNDTIANLIRSATLDHTGHVICTGTGGLAVFKISDSSFTLRNSFNNIINIICYSSIVRNGIAWINTNIGLINYDVKTGKSGIVGSSVTPSFSVEAFGVVGDEIVIHYRNAYSYFRPDTLLHQPLPSGPIIEELLVNNNPYDIIGTNTKLNYNQNILNFSFTAFNFNDPDHIKFRYKLKGLDDMWSNPTEQRYANFTGLPPGSYTFIVEAGYNGEWNRSSASFNFSILPPFWQRWWFRGLIIFIFTGGITGAAAYRVRNIKLREARKTAVNKMVSELEMKVLRSQMNPHFIFNSLNSIQKFIWENKQEDASEYLTKFSRLMRAILDNSMHKFITLEQELNTVTLYVELEHRRSSNKFDYVITVEDNLDTAYTLVPPLILQPYVENAIWHGLLHKDGRGELKISIIGGDENCIRVTVEDNGVGRTATAEMTKNRPQKSVSYGLNLTEERLTMTESGGKKGKVVIEDLYDDTQQPSGTRIVIFLPMTGFTKI
jgi:ligand-binding sensor domain-containing protein/two-component sensor histidine kinase